MKNLRLVFNNTSGQKRGYHTSNGEVDQRLVV